MKRLKKAGICVLAAAVVCGAAAGLFACNDEQAPKELAYVYGAAETVTPFWMNTYGDETVVYNEVVTPILHPCLLYTSDAADDRISVDLGGRRIIKKKIF